MNAALLSRHPLPVGFTNGEVRGPPEVAGHRVVQVRRTEPADAELGQVGKVRFRAVVTEGGLAVLQEGRGGGMGRFAGGKQMASSQ